MWAATTAWVVAAVVVVSGQNTDHHHHHSRVQSQQGEFPVGVEDEPGHERTINLFTYQPNQFSGDLPQQSNDQISQAREDGQRFTNDSSITHRGGGGGGGGDRQQSVLNRQHTGGGGGRRRQSGRGLRQGGGGRQRGGGRRPQQQGSGDYSNNSDNNRDTASSLDTDISQSHSNAMILLLQRLGDRLTGIEVLQRQQTERISTINYRLTKLELQAEERKSVTSDLGNAVRHRMETTDAELDQVNEHLDSIKTSIMGLGQQYSDLKVAIANIPKESDQRGNEVNGLKMQSMLGAVQELRTSTDQVKDNTEQLTKNLTALNMIAQNLTHLAEKMVTKQYLYENLNELRSQDSAVSLLAKMVMVPPPATSRRASSRKAVPEDCWQLMKQGKIKSGVYSIQPHYSPQPFFVYCDMETDGGGWTVIQRREDGSVDFLREWMDYKHGFGNVAGEYWLGNEKIHLLTNQQVSVLRVDVADFDQQVGHALYSAFAIGPEQEGYSLKILGQYSGDAGDSLRYHVGRRFSTLDVDNDAWPDRSCARDHMGAWWYRACETSNLNGRYLHGPVPAEHQYTGLYWYDFRGPQYSLWQSSMMVRRGGKVDRPVFRDFADVHNQTARVPNMQEVAVVTTTSPDDFDPNQDPYVTFEYPNL
ncbi:fibroleukin-like isoform X2 [Eriocheir sinensis]|uniref:fibroleukin-like isoform X2 n=1 Tax=Eriocheir sinensis TaxID=95602 RepID=UPI0021C840B5|nr:fibroleukin-like isoform X2 [Eriocheir sinensis]